MGKLLGHDLPFSKDEIHGLIEDQYVKAKYGNKEAEEFIRQVELVQKQLRKQKPKQEWLCIDCRATVTNRSGHIRDKHPGFIWFDGKIPRSVIQYTFIGV